MDSLVLFFFGLSSGFALGALGAWQLWLKHERPTVHANLVVDHKLMQQLDAAKVEAWLDHRGLTWQRKGCPLPTPLPQAGEGAKEKGRVDP